MKQTLLVSLALIAVAFLTPLLTSGQEPLIGSPWDTAETMEPAVTQSPVETAVPASPVPTPAESSPPPAPAPTLPPKPENFQSDADTPIVLLYQGQAVTLSLRELLCGILTSEMPFAYPDEALKAQVVAARTYTLYCMERGGHHQDADLCGDPSCCLAYTPIEQLAEAWGEEGYTNRVTALVDATDGQVLCYGGELCQTAFFAVSSGRTESAVDVWGNAVPYLGSVDSPWDESSEKYAAQVVFSVSEAKERLLRAWPSMVLGDDPKEWFGTPERSAAGGVRSILTGGVMVAGTDIRSVFSLASHNFTVNVTENEVRFDTRGHGHGVGLSQYGAGEMASAGSDYAEILAHYYQGTVLTYRTN